MNEEFKIFLQAVAEMRDLQKMYFRERSAGKIGVADILKQAKAKERQVDAFIEQLNTPKTNQQSLF